jgi:hypothetical protein
LITSTLTTIKHLSNRLSINNRALEFGPRDFLFQFKRKAIGSVEESDHAVSVPGIDRERERNEIVTI